MRRLHVGASNAAKQAIISKTALRQRTKRRLHVAASSAASKAIRSKCMFVAVNHPAKFFRVAKIICLLRKNDFGVDCFRLLEKM